MADDSNPPIFNAPRVVVWLIGALVAIHLAREFLLSPREAVEVLVQFALWPARYAPGIDGDALRALARPVPGIVPFVSHGLLHGDWLHVGFNSIWLLAFGTPVARALGNGGFLVLFAIGAVLGGLAFLAANPGLAVPMVGASGAISALMGSAVHILFAQGVPGGFGALANRRAYGFIGAWLAVNLIFGLTGVGVDGQVRAIAWEAHMGGFFVGLAAFPFLFRLAMRRYGR